MEMKGARKSFVTTKKCEKKKKNTHKCQMQMTIVGYKNYFLWVIENYCGNKWSHILQYMGRFFLKAVLLMFMLFSIQKKKNQINEFLYLVARYFLVT